MKEFPSGNDEKSENIPIKENVVFDNNSPQRLSESYESINGNIKLKWDYFPLITKRRDSSSPVEYSIIRSSPDVIYKSTSAKEGGAKTSFFKNYTRHRAESAKCRGVYVSVVSSQMEPSRMDHILQIVKNFSLFQKIMINYYL